MSWVLITGGSKGIGFSLAESFASRMYNIILVARDQQQLEESKRKLESKFLIQVEILSCDLGDSASPQTIYDFCSVRKLEITVLCNVAGLGGTGDFPDMPSDKMREMIRLNLESAILLTQVFLPVLRSTKPSFILHVASMAGFGPLTIKSVYSSTKSALISFCYSLKYLLKDDQISVSCLCPGPVFTKPSIENETIKQLGWFGKRMAVSPADLGEYAVRCLLNGKLIIVPGKMASFVAVLIKSLPKRMLVYLSYRFSRRNRLKTI